VGARLYKASMAGTIGLVRRRLRFEQGGWVYGNAVTSRDAARRARLGRVGRDIEPAEKKKH
jgi:hypothetical protein